MDRKYMVRCWITEMLTSAIRDAKQDNKYCAKEIIDHLRGMILYMQSVEDITNDTRKKIYNLTRIIVRKYNLY